jgi:hypothetical protein
MTPIKWLRKNNRKVMAVVVVFIMISFVLGAALNRLAGNLGGRSPEDAVWLFDEKGQISSNMQSQAEAELSVLLNIGMGESLLKRDPQSGQIGQRNFGMILLYQLLFPQPAKNENLNRVAKMAARQGQLPVSEEQIDKFFIETSENASVNWILLKSEAKKNGITLLAEQAEGMFVQANMDQRIGTMAKNMGLAKQAIYQAVADLMSVQMMLSFMTTGDNVTALQIQNMLSLQQDTFDAEFIKIPAKMFTSEIAKPTEDEIVKQFATYKDTFAGQLSSENPFGFGYKQPDKVKLEYVLVNIEDIEKQIPEATDEEAEQFYTLNLKDLKTQVRSDPADPNSPMVEKTIEYAKVAALIKRQIRQTKIDSKAQDIINSIKDTADASFADIDISKAGFEEVKAAAEDYAKIAEAASIKYNVPIKTGVTSLVSADELVSGSVLGNMGIADSKKTAVSLVALLFSIDQLSDRQMFDVTKPRMYESIGMLKDPYGKSVGLVRILEAQKSYVVDSIDAVIDINMPMTDTSKIKSYTIREKVAEDIAIAKAFEVAMVKAGEFAFAASIKDANWTAVIEQFNTKYAGNDPNAEKIAMDSLNSQRRMSLTDIEMARQFSLAQAGSNGMLSQAMNYKSFIDKVYSISSDKLPAIVDSKPDAVVYIFKDIKIKKMNVDEYQQIKNQVALALDDKAMQGASLVFLMPENIKSRMNFRLAEKAQVDPNDANENK